MRRLPAGSEPRPRLPGITDLQAVVDELERRFDRPVTLLDDQFRLLAYSVHKFADATRTQGLLARRAPQDAQRWVLEQGLDRIASPRRTDGVARLGMTDRICAPIRREDVLYGWIWIIDAGHQLDDAALLIAQQAAEEAARILAREHGLRDTALSHERWLLERLLADEPGDADPQELERLLGSGLERRTWVLAVARVAPTGEPPPSLRRSVALMRVMPRTSVVVRIGGDWVLLAEPDVVPAVARQFGRFAARAAAVDDERVIVGLSDALPIGLLPRALRQARMAAELLEREPTLHSPLGLGDAGLHRLVAELAHADGEQSPRASLHPGLVALMQDASHDDLVRTVEVYLDLGGEVQMASRELHLHRTSLYYRLRRFEELSGLHLRNGLDRLWAHVTIKVQRLLTARAPRERPCV